MTEGIRLPIGRAPLEPLIGFRVVDAWVGIGTFLVLDLAASGSTSTPTASLWVYLADWAVVVDDQEVRAADTLPENRSGRLPVDELIGRHLTAAARLNDEELHLGFSGGAHLEIWENRAEYGVGAELLRVFRDGETTTTLVFPQPSLH